MAIPTHARPLRQRRQPPSSSASPRFFAGARHLSWRQPFDALWRLFSSVRLAIVLITGLGLISTIGMLITQASAEVIASPQDYAGWLDGTARAEYTGWTDVLSWLQFFTIFHSWYFKLLVVVLALNILVGGMLNRAPGIWYRFRHPQLQRAEGFYVNSPVRVGISVGNADATTAITTDSLRQFLRRRGYLVALAPVARDEVAYLYAHKYTWSTLSTFVFHTSLIATMLCAVVTGWGGFGRNTVAQHILPQPLYTYFQNLAGFSYTQPMPDATMGVVYPQGTAHNIFYRAQQFVMTVDPQRMMPTDFYTDMQVFQDGKLVAQKRIRVNDPLTYQGVTFHQASFMMYTTIQLRDDQGHVVYSGAIPLLNQRTSQPDPNTGNIFKSNVAEDIPLSNDGRTMNLAAVAVANNQWVIGIKGFDPQRQSLFQGATLYGNGCINTDGTAAPLSSLGCRLSNGWWMQVNDVRRGTVFLVTKDAGSPLLWPVLLLLVLSLWVTFSLPPRRIWVRVAGDQVMLAALKEHFVNQQRELNAFARALGNRPLRVTPAASELAAHVAGEKKRKQNR